MCTLKLGMTKPSLQRLMNGVWLGVDRAQRAGPLDYPVRARLGSGYRDLDHRACYTMRQ